MRSLHRPLTAIVSTVFLASALMGVAGAHYDTGIYIYDSGRTQKDPMNLTFYSQNPYDPGEPVGLATYWNTIAHIEHHFGWGQTIGTDMWFWDHNDYRLRDDQRNSCIECPSQQHIRVKQGIDADPGWGIYTVAAAHIDEYRWCGIPLHVGLDFDGQRDVVQRTMNDQNPSDHPARDWYAFNNNTNPSPQCDGSMPRSMDGFTAWQKIIN